MTKADARKLCDQHGMQFARDPITRECTRVFVDVDHEIPELDAIADASDDWSGAVLTRIRIASGYRYQIDLPSGWVDLYGWAD